MNHYIKSKIALAIPALILLASCGSHNNIEITTDYLDIKIGSDFTDLNAKLTFLTNRTDLIQDTPEGREFPDYIADFNKLYPGISVTVEGITDYDTDMAARLSSGNWGDICCVPAAVAGTDYSDYFEPLGDQEDFSERYEFSDQCTNAGKVYGISSSGNVQGIVYNKRIWKEAGINELPKTPDEFINDLELIKKNTDSIPLYTNYEAVWPLSAWCSYMYACATGNENYKNYVLPYEKTPFSKKSDNTGPYEVFSILYNSVSKGLTEEDPTTTSWELSKGALNRGEISAMVLGSWSVSQIKDADSFADDVGYMPFPISVGGMQYSIAVGDYSYGINCKIPNERKTAAKIFIKYLIEDSGFAFDHESIPTLKGEEYPAVLESFEDTTFIRDIPPTEEDGDILSLLNADSELMFNSDSTCIIRIVDAALSGEETYDEIMNDWNKAWNKAQEKNNITISD